MADRIGLTDEQLRDRDLRPHRLPVYVQWVLLVALAATAVVTTFTRDAHALLVVMAAVAAVMVRNPRDPMTVGQQVFFYVALAVAVAAGVVAVPLSTSLMDAIGGAV
jgi:hypothetical protein